MRLLNAKSRRLVVLLCIAAALAIGVYSLAWSGRSGQQQQQRQQVPPATLLRDKAGLRVDSLDAQYERAKQELELKKQSLLDTVESGRKKLDEERHRMNGGQGAVDAGGDTSNPSGPNTAPGSSSGSDGEQGAADLSAAKFADFEWPANQHIHAFYYAWYGNPENDNRYIHWNHKVINGDFTYQPPDQIGANFYPSLGPYSSIDPVIVDQHMIQMREAGIGVVALSWYPPGTADDNGVYNEAHTAMILDFAAKHKLGVALHVEPFRRRDGPSTRDALVQFLDTYGNHPGLFRDKRRGNRPWIYIYDSYLTPTESWARVFSTSGDMSIRNTKYDVVAIALLVEVNHRYLITGGGFDGGYSYFATDGFTYGSTTDAWFDIQLWCKSNSLIWVPSVGPGYSDLRIRPWNPANQRSRENGRYYSRMWDAAMRVSPEVVSITSFNEWHEGTQIEPAVSRQTQTSPRFVYESYPENNPQFYLSETASHVQKYILEVVVPRKYP